MNSDAVNVKFNSNILSIPCKIISIFCYTLRRQLFSLFLGVSTYTLIFVRASTSNWQSITSGIAQVLACVWDTLVFDGQIGQSALPTPAVCRPLPRLRRAPNRNLDTRGGSFYAPQIFLLFEFMCDMNVFKRFICKAQP